MVDKSQKSTFGFSVPKPTPLLQQPKGDLKGLLELTHLPIRSNELVLTGEVQDRRDQVLLEQRQGQASTLRSFPKKNITLHGSSGDRQDDVSNRTHY